MIHFANIFRTKEERGTASGSERGEERGEEGRGLVGRGRGRPGRVVDKWEREKRLKRRTSVIVHGLEESEVADASERREACQVRVADMFRELECGEGPSINDVTHLGGGGQTFVTMCDDEGRGSEIM